MILKTCRPSAVASYQQYAVALQLEDTDTTEDIVQAMLPCVRVVLAPKTLTLKPEDLTQHERFICAAKDKCFRLLYSIKCSESYSTMDTHAVLEWFQHLAATYPNLCLSLENIVTDVNATNAAWLLANTLVGRGENEMPLVTTNFNVDVETKARCGNLGIYMGAQSEHISLVTVSSNYPADELSQLMTSCKLTCDVITMH